MRIVGWKRGNDDILQTFSGEEISVKDLFSVFWNRRFAIFAGAFFLLIVGILKLSTTTRQFSSVSTFLTEREANNVQVSGGFADLLGLTGGQINSQTSGKYSDPGFYPRIIESRPFLLSLASEPFYFATHNDTLTLQEYALRYDDRDLVTKWIQFAVRIPSRFLQWFDSKEESTKPVPSPSVGGDSSRNPIVIHTQEEMLAIDEITNWISISSGGNVIEITATTPDPQVSAELNRVVLENLVEFIIDKETEKERMNLAYVERRVVSARSNFEKSQQALARFRDENRGIISATEKTEEEKLQSQYSIDFGIYQRLATELEEKKIALEEKTPLMTVFEPVYVPLQPASRGGVKILLVSIIVGAFLGVMLITLVVLKNVVSGKTG